MTKQEYDQYSRIFTEAGCDPLISIEEHIQDLINRIIDSMYIPVPDERQFIAATMPSSVEQDAINWGDLKCTEVKGNEENGYIAYIEEADPGAHNLRQYIQNLLSMWRYNVEIITEW